MRNICKLVSIGTVLTLGIVGAVAIAAYGVYSNLGKVSGAITRGVETTVTPAFGNYFDRLFGGAKTNGGTGSSTAPLPLNPSEPAFGFLPEAEAPGSKDATLAITPQEAMTLKSRYLPKAQESAKLILQSFAPTSQEKLITTATKIAEESPTPALTQAYSIIDQARLSVGGLEPLTNKFYQLFTLANKPISGGKILPLSKEAVQYYAGVGVVAREVYL